MRRTRKQLDAHKLLAQASTPASARNTHWFLEAEALLDKAVQKVQKDYPYGNKGEAFVHVFVKHYFDLDDTEAANAAEYGRAGKDRGIDAVHVDENDRTIYIVQGKL